MRTKIQSKTPYHLRRLIPVAGIAALIVLNLVLALVIALGLPGPVAVSACGYSVCGNDACGNNDSTGDVCTGTVTGTFENSTNSNYNMVGASSDAIKVNLEGRELVFDVPPRTIEGRVMVPMRAIFEAMGASLDWNQSSQTAIAVKGSTRVVAQIGSMVASVNGIEQILEVPPAAIDGRSLAPLRFVAEAFGYNARWDGDSQTAYITASDQGDVPAENSDESSSSAVNTMGNTMGNTPGNIRNDGYVSLQGDWIYFVNGHDSPLLYRVQTNGNGLQRLGSDDAWDINAVGDWVYFSSGESLTRVKTDGSGKQDLTQDYPNEVTVVGDWVYYTAGPVEGALCRIKTDGSCWQQLTDETAFDINVSGEWIYYLGGDSARLCKIRTDGQERQEICDVKCSHLIADGDWLYYCQPPENGAEHGIYCRMRTDGSGVQTVADDYAACFNVAGNWAYYMNLGDNNSLYRIKTDGSGKEKLNDRASAHISIIGDWIYYYSENELCRMKTDGSCQETIPTGSSLN